MYYPDQHDLTRGHVAYAIRRAYSDARLYALASEYLKWPTAANWIKVANALNETQVVGSNNTGGVT